MATTVQPKAVDKRHRRYSTHTRHAAALLAAAVLALAIGNAGAQGVEISVLDAQYLTELIAQDSETATATQTTASYAPISNQLLGGGAQIYAKADADIFSVSTATSAVPDTWDGPLPYAFARATAKTVLSFRTSQDALAPLTFEFAGSSLSFYSAGLVSLDDLTASQSMLSYSWTCCSFRGNVPWEPRSGPFIWNGATLAPAPRLLASHEYSLTMLATTYANFDSQSVSIGVSGLCPVTSAPEPAAYAMMFAGLGVMGLATRRRAMRPGRRLAS